MQINRDKLTETDRTSLNGNICNIIASAATLVLPAFHGVWIARGFVEDRGLLAEDFQKVSPRDSSHACLRVVRESF